MRSALLAVAALALGLAAAEACLRLMNPEWVIPYPPVAYRSDLFERHDPYGYRLLPRRTLRHTWPLVHGRTVLLSANADGFRSRRDFRQPDGRTRIVVLGDSMVFGVGVEEPERFTEMLEEREPRWRLDNMGMVAYGPDLMVRALEAVGLDPPPAAVVLAIFSHDLYRVAPEAVGVGYPLPRFVLEEGRLTSVPYPERPAWQRIHLVQALRYLYWRYTEATFALNAAILDRFRALARTHRFRPAIVFVPGPRERWDDRHRRRWLRQYAERHGTPFLDLTEFLAAAGGPRLYIENDSHWNPAGHRVVARELHALLAPLVTSGPG